MRRRRRGRGVSKIGSAGVNQTITAPPSSRPGGPSKMFPELRCPVISSEEGIDPNDGRFITATRTAWPATAKALKVATAGLAVISQKIATVDDKANALLAEIALAEMERIAKEILGE